MMQAVAHVATQPWLLQTADMANTPRDGPRCGESKSAAKPQASGATGAGGETGGVAGPGTPRDAGGERSRQRIAVNTHTLLDQDASIDALARQVRMCLRTGQWLVVVCRCSIAQHRRARMQRALDLAAAYRDEHFQSRRGRIFLLVSADDAEAVPVAVSLASVKVAVCVRNGACDRGCAPQHANPDPRSLKFGAHNRRVGMGCADTEAWRQAIKQAVHQPAAEFFATCGDASTELLHHDVSESARQAAVDFAAWLHTLRMQATKLGNFSWQARWVAWRKWAFDVGPGPSNRATQSSLGDTGRSFHVRRHSRLPSPCASPSPATVPATRCPSGCFHDGCTWPAWVQQS